MSGDAVTVVPDLRTISANMILANYGTPMTYNYARLLQFSTRCNYVLRV
jgi:hypothetical protein